MFFLYTDDYKFFVFLSTMVTAVLCAMAMLVFKAPAMAFGVFVGYVLAQWYAVHRGLKKVKSSPDQYFQLLIRAIPKKLVVPVLDDPKRPPLKKLLSDNLNVYSSTPCALFKFKDKDIYVVLIKRFGDFYAVVAKPRDDTRWDTIHVMDELEASYLYFKFGASLTAENVRTEKQRQANDIKERHTAEIKKLLGD